MSELEKKAATEIHNRDAWMHGLVHVNCGHKIDAITDIIHREVSVPLRAEIVEMLRKQIAIATEARVQNEFYNLTLAIQLLADRIEKM